uniref:Uncharacterized protein n=1 Tax=Octopus bimaculoides TaxID=37653 RepID=A0A0L8FYK7_OCTBM
MQFIMVRFPSLFGAAVAFERVTDLKDEKSFFIQYLPCISNTIFILKRQLLKCHLSNKESVTIAIAVKKL